MKQSSIPPLRASTKHNVVEKMHQNLSKENAYSPVRRSPLRNSVSVNDPPSSKSSSSSDSSRESTRLNDITTKLQRLPSSTRPPLRLPSPTRTENRNAALRKSPQRLNGRTKEYQEQPRLSSRDIPDFSYELSSRRSMNKTIPQERSKSLLPRPSVDSEVEKSERMSRLLKKHRLSVTSNDVKIGCLKSSPRQSAIPSSPFQAKKVTFSAHDEIVSSSAPAEEKHFKEDIFQSSEMTESGQKILKIRSEFNRISRKLDEDPKSNDFITTRLRRHDSELSSLKDKLDLILDNQQKIMDKLGI